MSSIPEIIWNLTHTQTDQTPQIQHNLELNCFENRHLGIKNGDPPDLEMLVMIFHAQVIESCRDGSKHIRFCDSHVLCSKMGTYLWAIPNIRYSLATHYLYVAVPSSCITSSCTIDIAPVIFTEQVRRSRDFRLVKKTVAIW